MTQQTNTKSRRSSATVWTRVYQLLFWVYSIVLFWELFLGKYRSHGGPRQYNLTPLKTIGGYIEFSKSLAESVLLINLAGNIVAFMPLGFLLPLAFYRTNRWTAIVRITLFTSITAEICQFIFNVGSLDIDDVLLNTLGGVMGYLVYRYFSFLRRDDGSLNID